MSTRVDDAGVDGAGAAEGAEAIGGRAGCKGLGCDICAAAGSTIKAAKAVAMVKDRNFIGKPLLRVTMG